MVIAHSTNAFGYVMVRIMAGPRADTPKSHVENRAERAKAATSQNMPVGAVVDMVTSLEVIAHVLGRTGESLRQVKQAGAQTLAYNQDTQARGYSIVRFARVVDAVANAKYFITMKFGGEDRTLPSQLIATTPDGPAIPSLRIPVRSNPPCHAELPSDHYSSLLFMHWGRTFTHRHGHRLRSEFQFGYSCMIPLRLQRVREVREESWRRAHITTRVRGRLNDGGKCGLPFAFSQLALAWFV